MKLTLSDAVAMLGVEERVIYRWIRDEQMPVRRVNDQYRFNSAEILEWATARGIRVSSEKFRETAEQAPATFSDALAAGGIHYGVSGSDRESVLRAIVEKMPIEEADRDVLYDFLLAREALGSTGVGDGIAIPHVRNPIVLHVPTSTITLCFLEKSVDFHAIDDKPVSIVFLLVTSTIRTHLYLLSRLSAALHNPTFKEAVLRRAPAAEILKAAHEVEGTLSQYPREAAEK